MIILTKAEIECVCGMKPLESVLLTKVEQAFTEFCARHLVHLQITTWNTRPDHHWYGSLTYNSKGIAVTHELTVGEASLLNRTDFGLSGSLYKEGDVSCRFFSKESLIKAARAYFPDEPFLIEPE